MCSQPTFGRERSRSMVGCSAREAGMSPEVVETSPQKVIFKAGNCPLYEAVRALGWDHEAIEANCRAGAIRLMDAAAKQPSVVWGQAGPLSRR